jgi:hypothetical protein
MPLISRSSTKRLLKVEGDAMRTDTRLGVFEEVLKNTTPNVRELMEYFRNLIIELHEDTVEVPRPGERSAAYGIGPKKISEAYAYIMPHAEYVNLGFYHGTSLNDPAGLLEGTGKGLRHVKVYSLQQAQRPEIRALILESIAERKKALQV